MINKIKKIYICYPGGNINAIVGDQIPKKEYSIIAEKIVNAYNKGKSVDEQIEQVAFIEKPSNSKALCRLCLAGDEFSGNAVLCIAYIKLVLEGKINKVKSVYFEISGVEKPLLTSVYSNSSVCAQMPTQDNSNQVNYSKEGYSIIYLKGITQIIVNNFFNNNNSFLKNRALKIIKNNNLEKELAVGIIFINKINKIIKIKPYIYFKKGLKYNIYRETACGSASTAIGIYESIIENTDIKNLEVIQPTGNSIFVSIKQNRRKLNVNIKGEVKIIYQGPFLLES